MLRVRLGLPGLRKTNVVRFSTDSKDPKDASLQNSGKTKRTRTQKAQATAQQNIERLIELVENKYKGDWSTIVDNIGQFKTSDEITKFVDRMEQKANSKFDDFQKDQIDTIVDEAVKTRTAAMAYANDSRYTFGYDFDLYENDMEGDSFETAVSQAGGKKKVHPQKALQNMVKRSGVPVDDEPTDAFDFSAEASAEMAEEAEEEAEEHEERRSRSLFATETPKENVEAVDEEDEDASASEVSETEDARADGAGFKENILEDYQDRVRYPQYERIDQTDLYDNQNRELQHTQQTRILSEPIDYKKLAAEQRAAGDIEGARRSEFLGGVGMGDGGAQERKKAEWYVRKKAVENGATTYSRAEQDADLARLMAPTEKHPDLELDQDGQDVDRTKLHDHMHIDRIKDSKDEWNPWDRDTSLRVAQQEPAGLPSFLDDKSGTDDADVWDELEESEEETQQAYELGYGMEGMEFDPETWWRNHNFSSKNDDIPDPLNGQFNPRFHLDDITDFQMKKALDPMNAALLKQPFVGNFQPFRMASGQVVGVQNPIMLDDNARSAMWLMHVKDASKYNPRRLAKIFNVSLARVEGILRLQALQQEMVNRGELPLQLWRSMEEDLEHAADEDSEFQASASDSDPTAFTPAEQRFQEKYYFTMYDGDMADQLYTWDPPLPRIVHDSAPTRFVDDHVTVQLENYEARKRQNFLSRQEKLAEAAEAEFAFTGPMGSQKGANSFVPKPLHKLVGQKARTANILMTDISDMKNHNYQVAVRDQEGRLREPTPREFNRSRTMEKSKFQRFHYLEFKP